MHVGTETAVYGALAVVVAAAVLLPTLGGTSGNAAHGVNRSDQGTGASQDCSVTVVYTNQGSSMTPVIAPGQNITVRRGYYRCHNVSRGDIVVYNWTGNEDPLVKWVKAVPGDALRFDGCHLRRNGTVLKTSQGEPYCVTGNRKDMLQLYTGDSIDGYLLLGNQPSGTLDSTRFGIVAGKQIIGAVTHPRTGVSKG